MAADLAGPSAGGTAYPARPAWLHSHGPGRQRRVAFEPGAVRPEGAIEGNDDDPARYEPHHERSESAADVQIHEACSARPMVP